MVEFRFLGCLSFRPRWGLTGWGWLVLVAAMLGFSYYAVTAAYPFLAVSAPVQSNVLVVEGWLPDQALRQAVQEFHGNHCRLLVTTGGPLGRGAYLVRYQSYAQLAASTLSHLGMDAHHVVVIPAPWVKKDRTYASALALHQWLHDSGAHIHALNLLTLGPHARRSRLLFQEALGPSIQVGVIAVRDDAYDPARWWTSSAGVRTVIGEIIAYTYAKVFFQW